MSKNVHPRHTQSIIIIFHPTNNTSINDIVLKRRDPLTSNSNPEKLICVRTIFCVYVFRYSLFKTVPVVAAGKSRAIGVCWENIIKLLKVNVIFSGGIVKYIKFNKACHYFSECRLLSALLNFKSGYCFCQYWDTNAWGIITVFFFWIWMVQF